MAVQIGQYRYTSSSACMSKVESSASYRSNNLVGGDESAISFKDVQITTNTSMQRDGDYYLYAKFPQNMNYDLSFNVKLVKALAQGGTESYQFLKSLTIPRGGTGTNTYLVALYEKSNGSIAAMIPETYVPGAKNVKDLLYVDRSSNVYYLGNGNSTYTRTNKINDIILSTSWIYEEGVTYGYLEIVFRPVDSGFNTILFEMIRTPEDYNVQQDSDDGGTEYGRVVDLKNFSFELYQLNNLVAVINPDGMKLDRIGVSGVPGLFTAVNGEEIRIGPSGSYELSIIPITSLTIVARDASEQFTIDYSYNNA